MRSNIGTLEHWGNSCYSRSEEIHLNTTKKPRKGLDRRQRDRARATNLVHRLESTLHQLSWNTHAGETARRNRSTLDDEKRSNPSEVYERKVPGTKGGEKGSNRPVGRPGTNYPEKGGGVHNRKTIVMEPVVKEWKRQAKYKGTTDGEKRSDELAAGTYVGLG